MILQKRGIEFILLVSVFFFVYTSWGNAILESSPVYTSQAKITILFTQETWTDRFFFRRSLSSAILMGLINVPRFRRGISNKRPYRMRWAMYNKRGWIKKNKESEWERKCKKKFSYTGKIEDPNGVTQTQRRTAAAGNCGALALPVCFLAVPMGTMRSHLWPKPQYTTTDLLFGSRRPYISRRAQLMLSSFLTTSKHACWS